MMAIKPDQQQKQIGIVAVAKKKRQIHLYEKIQKGKPLSRPELKELENYEGPSATPGIVDSQEQVARVFNVKLRTVQYWVKDGMPVRPDGKYSIMEINAWRLAVNGGNGKQKTFGFGDKEKEETKFRRFKAMLAEIEYKEAVGELISKTEVERNQVTQIQAVKKSLLALPRRLAPQLVGLEAREIEVVLKKRMDEIIVDFISMRKTKHS